MKLRINLRTQVNNIGCGIHPQGWVPVETRADIEIVVFADDLVAFTPKGGCLLKLRKVIRREDFVFVV